MTELKNIDLKKEEMSIARILLSCTYGKKNNRLDVSDAVKRWKKQAKKKKAS